MIDEVAIRTFLMTWWEGVGLQPVIENEPRQFFDQALKAMAVVHVMSVAKLGIDETRSSEMVPPHATKLDQAIVGNRTVTVSCRVDSMTQEAGKSAMFLCEEGRTRLRTRKVIAAMREAGLALVDTGPVHDLPWHHDERLRSRAAFDVRLAAVAKVVDEPIDIIETIQLSTDYKHPDGTSLPAGAQLDEKLIDLT